MLKVLASKQGYWETSKGLSTASLQKRFQLCPCSKYFSFWSFCLYWWKKVQSTTKKLLLEVYYLCHQRHGPELSLISWFHCFLDAYSGLCTNQTTDTGVICTFWRAAVLSVQTALINGCLDLNMITLRQIMVLMWNRFYCSGHDFPFPISSLTRQDVHSIYFFYWKITTWFCNKYGFKTQESVKWLKRHLLKLDYWVYIWSNT